MAHTRRTLTLTTESRSMTIEAEASNFRTLPDVRAVLNLRDLSPQNLFFPAWDLTLDSSGRIAISGGAAATAQNVANEARLFTNDAYFVQDKGIPHFVIDLGQRLSPAVVRAHLRRAAVGVPDVKKVLAVNIETLDSEGRVLSGSIDFNTVGGGNGAITTDF